LFRYNTTMSTESGGSKGEGIKFAAQFNMFDERLGDPSVKLEFLKELPLVQDHTPLTLVIPSEDKENTAVSLKQPINQTVVVFSGLESFLGAIKGKKIEKPSGLVIRGYEVDRHYVVGSLGEELREVARELSKGRNAHQRRLWWVEGVKTRKLSDEERKEKERVVTGLGLVEARCSQTKSGLVFITARPEKKPERKRVEKDITTSGGFEKAYEQMVADYQRQGYVVDATQILDRCHHTTNPWATWRELRAGFGVRLTNANCGTCEWEVDPRGVVEKKNQCDDPGCKAVPVVRETDDASGKVIVRKGIEVLRPVCPCCGQEEQRRTHLIRHKGHKIEVLVEIVCGKGLNDRYWRETYNDRHFVLKEKKEGK